MTSTLSFFHYSSMTKRSYFFHNVRIDFEMMSTIFMYAVFTGINADISN